MKPDSLLRSTSLFSLATFISRILGLARDACISNFVPSVWQDIFWVGFRIPSTFRQLFAEGALSAAFIPLLTRVREREGEEKGREVSFAVLNLLALSVIAVVILGILFAPWLVPLILSDEMAAGQDMSMDWIEAQAIRAVRIMFPFLFFIALSAWAMGVLNTHRVFFIPALASAFFNVCVIIGAVLAWKYEASWDTIVVLGGAVVAGGFMQYAVQIPSCYQLRFFPPRMISPFHPAVMDFLRKLAPSVFGLAVYQLNALISQTYFASKYGEGAISVINYAHRLIQFPLGMVGVALATASFPRISQYLEQGREKDASKTLNDVFTYLLILMLPASAGLIVMGPDILGAIFNRGEFLENDWLTPTYQLTAIYSTGLFFYAGFGVMVRTFQAHHDFRTPVITGTISVAANIGLCAWFSTFLGLWSMALAAALSGTLNLILLVLLILPRMPSFRLGPLFFIAFKALIATAGMSAVCWAFCRYFPAADERFLWYSLRTLFGVGLGMAAFAAFGWLIFRRELIALVKRKN